MRFWRCEALGLPAPATLRCLQPLPDGMAIGADRGLVLYRGGRFLPFPWPRGARHESRVEAMALHDGVLHIATTRSRFSWSLEGPVKGQGMPRDPGGVYDEIHALFSDEEGLVTAWRTHLEGAEGPGEVGCLARTRGSLWAGTLTGKLYADGALQRTFKGPIRHLLAHEDRLYVAAGGALHTFDGAWHSEPGEPYALAWCEGLCLLRRGKLEVAGSVVDLPLARPWSLASSPDGLWIGGVGGLVLRDP